MDNYHFDLEIEIIQIPAQTVKQHRGATSRRVIGYYHRRPNIILSELIMAHYFRDVRSLFVHNKYTQQFNINFHCRAVVTEIRAVVVDVVPG